MSHFRTQVDFHLRIGLQVILLKYETVAKGCYLLKYYFVHAYVYLCTCECQCQWRPKEGRGSSRAGVKGGWEPSPVGAGRAASTPHAPLGWRVGTAVISMHKPNIQFTVAATVHP